MIKFLRTTHVDGIPKRFSKDADQFWRRISGLVGHMTDPNTPMTLGEIHEKCEKYVRENEESGKADISFVAYCLIKMAEYGMVKIVES